MTTTLAQLATMTDKEQQPARQDLLLAAVATPSSFLSLIDRSRAVESSRLQVFTVDHVNRLHTSAPKPTAQEPEQLLGYAIAQNRAYLAADGQEILTWGFPLYEAGMERYVIDLLCYDEAARRAMLVCIRSKTTQRRWLWEALVDSLNNWVAVTNTPDFAAALEGYTVAAPPLLVVVAPTAVWTDNAPGAGAHVADVASGHELNQRVLTAIEEWLAVPVLLLQVPDTWLRTVEDLDHPHVSPAPFPRSSR